MCNTTSQHRGAMRASGFLGAVMQDRVGPHNQGLSHHTPVRRRTARRQAVSPAVGIRHVHGDGDRTRTGQDIKPQVVYLLPSSSVFPVYTKVRDFSTCILKCHPTSRLLNRFHQFSLNDVSELPNIGSAFQFYQPKVLMKHLLTSYL